MVIRKFDLFFSLNISTYISTHNSIKNTKIYKTF